MRLALAHSLLSKWRRPAGSRTSTSVGVLLAAVVLAGVGACYTSPINMAPTVEISALEEPFRNTVLSFKAQPSDPDNDKVTVNWAHNAGGCDSPPPATAFSNVDSLTYDVSPPDTDLPFCVWARASDSNGAMVKVPSPVLPKGRTPTGEVVVTGDEVNGMFTLFREIVIDVSNARDPDNDPVTPTFFIHDPSGDLIPDDRIQCFNESTVTKCLTPQLSGPYTVDVMLNDMRDGSKTISKPILVAEDAPPCLKTTMPDVNNLAMSKRRDEPVQITVVEVDDDGDGYDGSQESSQIQFTWYRQVDMGPMLRDSRTTSYYPIGRDEYNLGQKVKVRLEIADRNVERSRRLLAECGDADLCASTTGCLQRMTWTVTYIQ